MIETHQSLASKWFNDLRNQIRETFEDIELEFMHYTKSLDSRTFEVKPWKREGGGGGEISIMKGRVFEKVGVNISTVHGSFDEKIRAQIPGTENSPNFFATGISVVAHPCSPLIPAAHFNTRYMETSKTWFGGGADITPVYDDKAEIDFFHNALKNTCDAYQKDAYQNYTKACDDYFYLPHRSEPRGAGGIFYDYLNSNDFTKDFTFTQNVGKSFLSSYKQMVLNKMHLTWSDKQKQDQLIKRGRYIEFNLLYDRGTKFGLMTNGNIEAIFMSLPPIASWV